MSPVLETTPVATQAAILNAVLNERYPRHALPAIASRYSLTLVELQAVLNRHGYPDTDQMASSARKLAAKADEIAVDDYPAASPADADDDEPYAETLVSVPVGKVHVDPDNPRENLTDIEELAESIVTVGLLQPIVVRRHEGHLVVVAGHRRLAAVKHLHYDEVRCIIRSKMRPDDVLAAMLIENGQRTDLDPIEEARALRRLKAIDDCTDTRLARKIGRSQPYVSSRLALLSLSIEEQDQVRAGGMSLIEGTNKGRLNSGKVGTKGVDRNWHLGPNHELAQLAKARCKRLGHPRGRTVGGMACGQCWESVIRADERDHTHLISAQRGECQTCGHVIENPEVVSP